MSRRTKSKRRKPADPEDPPSVETQGRDDPPQYDSTQYLATSSQIRFVDPNPEFNPTPPSPKAPADDATAVRKPCSCCRSVWRLLKRIAWKGYTSLLRDDGFSNLNTLKVRRLLGIALAEMLGTAFFLATGCGNLVSGITGSEPSHINTVLSFALGISTSILIFAPISGPMLNPCLNVTWLIMGHMSLVKFIFYTIFQVIGAYLGVAFIVAVSGDVSNEPHGFCTTHPNADISIASAWSVEFFMSFYLSLGLCNVLDKRVSDQHSLVFAKFAIVVVALALPLAKYEGGSVNPARSLGPAILSGDWQDQWIYWTAPILGAAVGAVLYRSFLDAPIFEEPETNGKRRDDATI